jgi:hypothetical protein
MLLHQPAEIGEVGQVPLAAEQMAAEFLLQLVDRTCERRNGHATVFRGAGEIEGFAGRKKIPDLVSFHRLVRTGPVRIPGRPLSRPRSALPCGTG